VHLESAFYRFVARAARILEVSAIEERIATLANLLQQLIGKALSEASAGAGSLLFILRHPEHTDNLSFSSDDGPLRSFSTLSESWNR
jgi:hypothetical protein